MAVPLHEIQKYTGKRVCMRFDDGLKVAACLTNVTQDEDGSIHLIYDHAEKLDGVDEALVQADQIYYATGKSLVEIYALHDPCDT
jgi:hypothetical protein